MNELTINLQTGSKIPLYEQIYRLCQRRIFRTENFQARRNCLLPERLQDIWRSAEVPWNWLMNSLMSEGYMEAEPCRGYFVAQIEDLYRMETTGADPGEKKCLENKEMYRYDFTPNGVDLKSFPYNAWRKLSKESLVG